MKWLLAMGDLNHNKMCQQLTSWKIHSLVAYINISQVPVVVLILFDVSLLIAEFKANYDPTPELNKLFLISADGTFPPLGVWLRIFILFLLLINRCSCCKFCDCGCAFCGSADKSGCLAKKIFP
jgi:hypothetical protein